MEIPKEVIEIAKTKYIDDAIVKYLGIYEGEQVYIAGPPNDEERDDGMPVLIFYSNGNVRLEIDDYNLGILDFFQESSE